MGHERKHFYNIYCPACGVTISTSLPRSAKERNPGSLEHKLFVDRIFREHLTNYLLPCANQYELQEWIDRNPVPAR